jgi:DNA-binding transcriptional MocR family regulator
MDYRHDGTRAIETLLGRWSDGPGPLHVKLRDALRQAIELGHLTGGERLPSERELAVRLAVSRSTVVAAYDALRGESRLESRQGSGTRVCGNRHPRGATAAGVPVSSFPISPVYRALIEGRDDLISLACAVFPAHPLVAEALADLAATNDKLFATTGYAPAGLPSLREGLAEMLSADGLPTTPEQVVVTTGAQQAVSLSAQLFVRAGDDVLVESPSFAGTIDVFRARGARFVTAPIDDDGIDLDVVANLVATRKPNTIYVMPSFHNPTGARMSERRRRALAELATTERIAVIEDNALEHAPLDDAPRLRPIAAFAPDDAPIVTAGSLSKAAWGGLRVGWLRGPLPVMQRIAELKAMNDLGSPLLEQAIAARLLPHIEVLRADHSATLRRHLDVVCDLLAVHLPDWRWTRPRGGPSLWVQLPSGSAATFAQVALRYGVEVIPGDVMSPTADHRDHLRLPFTLEPPVLEETVRRLAAAWRAYAPSDDQHPAPRPVVV